MSQVSEVSCRDADLSDDRGFDDDRFLVDQYGLGASNAAALKRLWRASSGANGKFSLTFAFSHFAIGIAGSNVTALDKDRIIHLTSPSVTTSSQGAKRVAVIALASCDDVASLATNGDGVAGLHASGKNI